MEGPFNFFHDSIYKEDFFSVYVYIKFTKALCIHFKGNNMPLIKVVGLINGFNSLVTLHFEYIPLKGSMPSVELVRQILNEKKVYDLDKNNVVEMAECNFVAAATSPGMLGMYNS